MVDVGTRSPVGDVDPVWVRIGWDEALALAGSGLCAIADEVGPESVVFSVASPSTTLRLKRLPPTEMCGAIVER